MVGDQKIKDRLEGLIRGVRSGEVPRGTKKSRVVLAVLDQVESALSEGIPRAVLAAEFGWGLRTFEGALYRARRLRERKMLEQQAETHPSQSIEKVDEEESEDVAVASDGDGMKQLMNQLRETK